MMCNGSLQHKNSEIKTILLETCYIVAKIRRYLHCDSYENNKKVIQMLFVLFVQMTFLCLIHESIIRAETIVKINLLSIYGTDISR